MVLARLHLRPGLRRGPDGPERGRVDGHQGAAATTTAEVGQQVPGAQKDRGRLHDRPSSRSS